MTTKRSGDPLSGPSSSRARVDSGPDNASSQADESMDSNSTQSSIAAPRPPREGKAPRQSEAGGILQLMARQLSAPFPIHEHYYLIVNSEHMVNYFGQLYDSIVNAIYPDTTDGIPNLITKNNWNLVCRYLTKARCDHVYGSISGKRSVNRIAIPYNLEVPNSLGIPINGIGQHIVLEGGLVIIPQSEPDPADPAMRLNTLCTHVIMTAFTRLVQDAKVRGILRVTTISRDMSGTGWWTISARDAVDPNNIAIDCQNIVIRSFHRDFTPSDAILAAMIQRQYDGELRSADVNAAVFPLNPQGQPAAAGVMAAIPDYDIRPR